MDLTEDIYSVISAMFRDAKLADLIEQSPCVLDERQLGPLTDKDPEWRHEAVFTREEVETIISDARVPPDRQVVYALELLAGVRTGEAAALRWRHYDAAMRPLGKLLVAKSSRRSAANGATGSARPARGGAARRSQWRRWWRSAVGRETRAMVAVGGGRDDLGSPVAPAAELALPARLGLRPSVARPRRRPGAAGARTEITRTVRATRPSTAPCGPAILDT